MGYRWVRLCKSGHPDRIAYLNIRNTCWIYLIEVKDDDGKQSPKQIEFEETFMHYKFPPEIRQKILNTTPLSKSLNLNQNRASMFITNGGRYYRAHKDGINNRISLNYTVEILDDNCVTSWYSDKDITGYEIVGLDWKQSSREAKGFDKTKHTPIKSMTAKPNECILFNTDIWHDFDNSKSTKRRMVLTLRVNDFANFYFNDAKKLLDKIGSILFYSIEKTVSKNIEEQLRIINNLMDVENGVKTMDEIVESLEVYL
jgi:hypothetical protein